MNNIDNMATFDMKPKNDQEKHAKIFQEFTNLAIARNLTERQWIANYLTVFTKDKYILKRDGAITRLHFSNLEKDKLYTRIQKLLPIYRAMFSKIYKANPIFRIRPNSFDVMDENGSDLAEAIIKQDYAKWKRSGVISKMALWYIITGNGYSKVQFNEDVGDIIGFDESGSKVKTGDIELKAIPPFLIYHDIGMKINTIHDCRKTYEVVIMDREYAMDVYKIEKDEGRITDSLRYKILLSGDYLDIEATLNKDDFCEVMIYTEKKSKINENGNFIMLTDKRILKDNGGNPFPDKIGHPYSQAKMIENGLGLGVTSLDFSTQADKEINLSRGQLNEHAEKLSSPILAIPMKSQIKAETIGNRKVKAIYYDERYGAPKYIQPGEFSQYFHLNEQKFVEDLNDINAIHDPTRAKRPSGVRSALMLAYLGEQDDIQHAPMIDNFFSMLEMSGWKYLEMKKEFLSDDEMDVRIFGNDNIKYTKYKGSQLKDNTQLEVIVASGLPMNRVAKQQMLLDLTNSGIISPSLMRELLEMGELEAVYKINMKDRARQNEENELLKKGDTIEVSIEDNHIIHLKVIVELAKTSAFHSLPQNIQDNFWAHAQAHVQMLITTLDQSPLLASLIIRSEQIDPETKDFIMAEIQKSASKKAEQNPQAPPPQAPQGVPQAPQGVPQAPQGVPLPGGM